MSQRTLVLLNENLMVAQGVTEEQKEKLYALHSRLNEVISNPLAYDDPVSRIEEIEYELQENWNFNLDKNKHTHWSRIRGCSCDKYRNRELFGTSIRIYARDCLWHGDSGE